MNDQPSAWSDPATRRSANRPRSVALPLMLIGLVAAGACIALILTGRLGEAWGVPALVGAGAVAVGALAGGIALLVRWSRLRSLLAAGPWLPGELTLAEDQDAELAHGRASEPIRLEVRSAALGDPGTTISVEVRSDGERMLITAPPRRELIRARAVT